MLHKGSLIRNRLTRKHYSIQTTPKQRKIPTLVDDLVNRSVNLTQKQSDLLHEDATTIIEYLRSNQTSSEALVDACLKQIERTQNLNLYITVKSREELLDKARSIDSKRRNGESCGVLSGLPIAVKDNFNVKDTYTTCGSKMLENYKSPYDSTFTSRLEQEGGIILGKCNLDEFAMGSTNTNSYFGPTINPWSYKCGDFLSTGGSSGGSAGALASRTCFASCGSDTGGSVRLPASWCGLVGLKPTYGITSRFGLVQYGSSLDVPGLYTKSSRDARLLLDVIKGIDKNDSTSVEPPSNIVVKKDKFRVGIPKEYFVKELSSEMVDLWESGIRHLEEQGCEIVDISLPHTKYAIPTYYIIAPAEASSNLARYDGVRYGHREEGTSVQDMYTKTRTSGFGDEVQRRIIIGTFVLSKGSYDNYYKKALQIRRLVRDDFMNVFRGNDKVDVILTPTTTGSASPLSQFDNQNPLDEYVNDVFTIPANLAGLPALAVPISLNSKGLPVGLQLMAPQFHDHTMVNVGELLEKSWETTRMANAPV